MEPEKEEKLTTGCWVRTVFACGGAVTVWMFNGVVETHSSVLLPQLEDKDSFIHVTPEEESWIASLGILIAPFAAILSGPSADYLGRKIMLQCFFLMSAVGYGIIAVARNVFHLYVGRLIGSCAIGFEIIGVIYIAEVCAKEQRSILLSVTLPMFTGGILFTNLVGVNLPWNVASAVFSLLCLLLFLYECFTPESPPWLVKKGRIEDARKSFKRLGRSEENIEREIKLLKMSYEFETKETVELKTFLEPRVWKPFLIIGLFHFLQVSTGVYNVVYYSVNYIEQLKTNLDATQVSLYIAFGRFLVTSTFGLYFMVKVKRKIAVTVSAVLMGIPLLIAAIYEFIYADESKERQCAWIPAVTVFLSIVLSSIGLSHMPWLMSGEVFPLHVRGAMSGAVFFIGTSSMFMFLKSYFFFIETIKISGLLLFSAIMAFMNAFFGAFILTETQNKSLLEIEHSYSKKSGKSCTEKPDA